MAREKKQITKEATKAALIEEFNSFMSGNGNVTVVNKDRKRIMISPKTTIVENGYSFNLRATTMFDSPFIEDQDSTGLDGVKVKAIVVEDSETITNRCIAMYMFFHNQRGNLYDIEDRVKTLAERTEERKVRVKAMKVFTDNEHEDNKLFAAYAILTGKNPYATDRNSVLNTLDSLVVQKPAEFIKAMEDTTPEIRLTYYKAIRQGLLSVSNKEITMKGTGVILHVPADKVVEDAFIDWAISKAGELTYESICKKLDK